MGDYDDRFTFLRKRTHDIHELVNLLRSENGRRLVEYEYVGITVEHLENLDPLLHADCDIFYYHVRIDIQSVFLTEFLDPAASAFRIKKESSFLTQNYVLSDCVVVNKLEVLVHHADAQVIGIIGRVYPYFLSPDLDDSPVCVVQTEEDAHQCGLSGTVLAKNRMNLAFPHLQRYVIVCHNSGEFLADADHFDYVV